jgi:hypothetical protein
MKSLEILISVEPPPAQPEGYDGKTVWTPDAAQLNDRFERYGDV